MKRYFNKYIVAMLLILTITYVAPASRVCADMGPKPSVVITFEGIEKNPYYVTLLSKEERNGPWFKGKEYQEWEENEEVWKKFNDYSDADGFCFLGYFEECSKNHTFDWTYYPPATFKILLYFPEEDQFVISKDTYERYAFDSYFTVNAKELDLSAGMIEEGMTTRSYPISSELSWMLCRVVATILIEFVIALLFGYRKKKQMGLIIVTNIVTQGLLNGMLNFINYTQGGYAAAFNYILLECAVFLIEGTIYQKFFTKEKERPSSRKRVWLYALTANMASFLLGALISYVLPNLF